MCCAIFILYNWVFASLNRMKSTQSFTNFVSSIVVFPERSRGRFWGNALYLDALQKLTSRAKSPFCAINMSNHLNVGFRILWCELWCVRLDVLVEKRTRPNMQRVLGTFFQFSQNSKNRSNRNIVAVIVLSVRLRVERGITPLYNSANRKPDLD